MTNKDLTHIAIIADRSGSMSALADDMNGGLKTFLEEQEALPGELRVDITRFDNEIEAVHVGVPVSEVAFPVIVARGSTALNDALGTTIVSLGERLAALPEDERPGKVLFVIVTDGYENASKEYYGRAGSDRIKALVEKQKNEYQWEFIFLGANIDSFAVGSGWGISKGATLDYTPTAAGVTGVFAAASAYTSTYRGGGSAGLPL